MKQILFIFLLSFSLQWASANNNDLPPAEVGIATFYDDSFHGRKTACSGETYDKTKLTAAHKTLPCGTVIRVTHAGNKKSVTVRIIDRGPYIAGQIVSLSKAAAAEIGLLADGQAKVKVEVVSAEERSVKPVKKQAAAPKAEVKAAKKAAARQVAPTSKPAVKSTQADGLNIIKEASALDKGGLYKMQVLKLEPKGFGVQVAGYSDYESVVQQVAVLQKNWFKGALVYADELNGKPYYKIIMGPFFTKSEAESYRKNLQKKYKLKGAFVVELDKLGK